MKMTTTTGTGPGDPMRLVRSDTIGSTELAAYAARTRTEDGDRDGAAWYRLRSRLNAALAATARRWTRACLASGVLTAALGLSVFARSAPLPVASQGDRPPSSDLRRTVGGEGGWGLGGAAGSVETGGPGAGGMEGSTGARGSASSTASG